MTTKQMRAGNRRMVAFVGLMLSWVAILSASRHARAETSDATPVPASADDEEQARAFFEIGAQAYELERYAEAIEAFRNAYQRWPRPGLLFSIAQAHRRAFLASGDAEQLTNAVRYYRAYLSSPAALHRKRDAELALERLVPLRKKAARAEVDDDATEVSLLTVSTATRGALVQIDGEEAVTTLPHVATVTPGTHEVTLAAPGYASQTRRILVPAGASFALAVDLQPLPANLAIRGLEDSEVWLDGRLVARLPVSRLAVSAGAHQLVVRRQGKRSYERSLLVSPGTQTDIDVELTNTPRRDTSIALFAASGACLLGTGALALLSWSEQGAARDWGETKNERSLLASEHAAYEDAVRHKNQYRTAALGTGVAGAALGLVGAVLFALDTPPLPDPVGATGEGPTDEGPAFEALPAFDTSAVSLQLRGHL